MTRAEEALQNLTRFGAGAIDEFLLGVPEFAAKKIGDRKAVEEWIAKAPRAYKAGEAAGTVGSLFVPYAGVVGKAAKGIGIAAPAATKLIPGAVGAAKKGVDWGKILSLAKRGAIAGGAESGIRGVTSESGDVVGDIGRGALFGAGGGVIAGKIAEKAPDLIEKLRKITSKAYLGGRGVNTRSMVQGFKGSMPAGAGPQYMNQKAGEYLSDVADFAKTVPRGEGMTEAMSKKHSDVYKMLDDAWKQNFQGAKAKDVISGLVTPEDIAKIADEFGDETAVKAQEIIIKGAEGSKGLAGMKNFFQRKIDAVRTGKFGDDTELAGAVQALASGIRNRLDDIAVDLVEKTGIGINPAELRKAYRLAKPIEIANVRGELAIPQIGGGSPTFEKFAANSLLGGGAKAPDLAEAARYGLSSLAGTAGMKAATALGSRTLGALDTGVKKYGPAIGAAMAELPEAAGTLGGRAAADLAKPATKQEVEAVDLAEEAGKAEATGRPEAYIRKVEERIAQFWATSGAEEQFPGQFEVFKAIVRQQTGDYDPEKAAPILFPDKDQREKFVRAYAASKRLGQSFETAEDAPTGLLAPVKGFFDTEETKAQQQAAVSDVLGVLAAALEKAGAPDANKTAKYLLDQVVMSNAPPQEKRRMIENVLARFGVDFGTLQEAGIA